MTSILLADDHKIIREGLRALLETQEGFRVIAEANDGRETVRMASELRPDVVIMDVAMPDLNGIDATSQLAAACPEVSVIALSMHSDKRFVGRMLQAHAKGYLLKDCASEELVQAIHTVMAGDVYLSPRISGIVVEDFVGTGKKPNGSAFSILTTREREVLQMLAEGHSTKHIAGNLKVSSKTIDTYRLRMMNKLDVHSVAELTKYAIREGLTSLDN